MKRNDDTNALDEPERRFRSISRPARVILLLIKPSPRVYKCIHNDLLSVYISIYIEDTYFICIYIYIYYIYLYIYPSSHLFILTLHISARHERPMELSWIQTYMYGLEKRLKSHL